ncbi:tetratricopeptide repeat protein [Candidatus Persebacteraceae bacterium Df01]|jgi:tetratricopeptide (TPR) repeat protein|uniref:Tetratricopeptide repeat protein n=1 Tax=Candidatus Doriopsillibacter californiensis TaxID=2970740 RepID=A0ABT7QJC2_9GAMM|nr:tetratricopeptide repeat protein [Candidatus Persebacteraceae bacterium Df01]
MSLLLNSLKKADEENKVQSSSEVFQEKPASAESVSGAEKSIDFDTIVSAESQKSIAPSVDAGTSYVGAAKVFRAGGERSSAENTGGSRKKLISVSLIGVVALGSYFALSNNVVPGLNFDSVSGLRGGDSSPQITSSSNRSVAAPKLKVASSQEGVLSLPIPRIDVQAEIDFAALQIPRADDLSSVEEKREYVEKIAILTGYDPRLKDEGQKEKKLNIEEGISSPLDGEDVKKEEVSAIVNAESSRARKKKLDALTSYESVLKNNLRIHSSDSGQDSMVAEADVVVEGQKLAQTNLLEDDKKSNSDKKVNIAPSMDGVERNKLLLQAQSFYKASSYAEAESLYRQVLVRNPTNIDALHGLALVAVASGRYKLAVATYLQILDYYPSDSVAIADLANLHNISNQNMYELEAALKKAIGDNAVWDSRLYFSLGNLYASNDRWLDAQEAYFEAHSRELRNPDYSYNLAVVLDYLAKSELAINYYELSLKLSKNSVIGFDANQVKARINKLRK